MHVNYKLGPWGFCPSPAGKYNGTKQSQMEKGRKKERKKNFKKKNPHSTSIKSSNAR